MGWIGAEDALHRKLIWAQCRCMNPPISQVKWLKGKPRKSPSTICLYLGIYFGPVPTLKTKCVTTNVKPALSKEKWFQSGTRPFTDQHYLKQQQGNVAHGCQETAVVHWGAKLSSWPAVLSKDTKQAWGSYVASMQACYIHLRKNKEQMTLVIIQKNRTDFI